MGGVRSATVRNRGTSGRGAGAEGVAIVPIHNSGALNVSDYFWGVRSGPGVDIPSSEIDKIWLVREWSYYHYNI